MRTTSCYSFYCRPSKINKRGLAPIECSIIINGKRITLNLPRKEKPSTFHKMLGKRNSDLSIYLNTVQTRLNEAQTQLVLSGIPITASSLKEYVQSGGIKTYTLSDMFDEYQKLLDERLNVDLCLKSYQKYVGVKLDFLRVFGESTEADAITPAEIAQYYAELKSKFMTSTSASKMLKVKAVFRFAFDSGKIKSFPFTGIKIVKGKPDINYLTKEELDMIRRKHFTMERLEKVKDLFLFQAGSGLSYGDMRLLQPEDVKEHNGQHYIKKQRMKTGIEFTSILMPFAYDIFQKYDGRIPVPSNQKLNAFLKEIQDICGIKKNLTSAVGRRTYSTAMLNSGVSITTVAKMLGHSNSIITQKHYAKVLDETVFNEVNALQQED